MISSTFSLKKLSVTIEVKELTIWSSDIFFTIEYASNFLPIRWIVDSFIMKPEITRAYLDLIRAMDAHLSTGCEIEEGFKLGNRIRSISRSFSSISNEYYK
mmetsp:Transcript_3701/g.6483  ORF Transcript_3701/g.6483 Transcript_3701/m.6483 type:complete len:101 (-) Transcript_3701:31-333(-)